MRSLKLVFLGLITLLLISFLSLLHSTFVVSKLFEFISQKVPLSYSSINGNLYDGITLKDLNYDETLKIEEFYVHPSIISLLAFEVYIYDIKLKGISFDEKLLKSDENSQNSDFSINLPFTLFIKNMEASLYNYQYEDYKIEQFLINSQNISSDFKNYLDANFNLTINANFVKNLFAFGEFKLNPKELQIKNLQTTINHDFINSYLFADFTIQNFDINSLIFNLESNTTLNKTIYKNLQKDVQIKTTLNGNLNEINFKNEISQNSLNINNQIIDILSSQFDGNLKLDKNQIDVSADFNSKTNLANQKSKIELKLNTQKTQDFTLKAKTILSELKHKDLKANSIGQINIDTLYKKNALDIKMNSKIADISLFTKDLEKFIFDLNIKDLNPNDFYKLDENLKISNLKAKLKGEYKNDLSIKGDVILNNSFILNTTLNGNEKEFNANINNNSFNTKISKTQNLTNIKTSIKSIENFENELNKIVNFSSTKLSGLMDFDVIIDSNDINFSIFSPKIVFDKNNFEKITIKGNYKENNIFFKELKFSIFDIYEINLQKDFVLKNQGFFNIQTFNSNLNFDNLSIQSSKIDGKLNINIDTNELFLSHKTYGSGFVNSKIFLDINENNKILIGGEIRVTKLSVIYEIPNMSISRDKDIIIISKNAKIDEKNIFFEDIALELSIFSDNLKYSAKNIDLKASTVLYLKKGFSDDVKIYGTLFDISGNFTELGKTYKIENSSIYFRGLNPIDPLLDIHALNKLTDVDISIVVGGTLNYPRINFHSTPIMSQKDILSYLIFGTKFASSSENKQSNQSQASLFLLNELSKDYAKELGLDILYFQYNPSTQYIETLVGKNISQKSKIVLKNKADSGQIILMRELTKLWNVELGFEGNNQSLDLIYKKRY